MCVRRVERRVVSRHTVTAQAVTTPGGVRFPPRVAADPDVAPRAFDPVRESLRLRLAGVDSELARALAGDMAAGLSATDGRPQTVPNGNGLATVADAPARPAA
jgi:hypothetical protein